jgi:hypothetical protein
VILKTFCLIACNFRDSKQQRLIFLYHKNPTKMEVIVITIELVNLFFSPTLRIEEW